MKAVVLAMMVAAALPATVVAAGLRDLDDAWLVDEAAARILLERPGGAWRLSTGGGRLFGMDELVQVAGVAAYRGAWCQARFSWQQLGRGVFRESCATGELRYGRSWQLGVVLERRRQIGRAGPQGDGAWATLIGPLGTTGSWRLDWPLTTPTAWLGARGLSRWLRVQQRLGRSVVALAIDRRGDGSPAVAIEVLCGLAPAMAVGVRYDGASGALGPVTAWRRGGLLVRFSHLAHPQLGVTHRWSVGVAL